MANYSTDTDLVKIRPNILNLGIPEWSDRHAEAKNIIDRRLIREWYKQAAVENGVDYTQTEFDPDNLEDGALTRLSCYKALELIYMFLMNDHPEEDGFERQMKTFRQLYNEEFKEIMSLGINYDWDEDGVVASNEMYHKTRRRLYRS